MLAATPRLHAIHATRGLAAVAVLVWHYQHFYEVSTLERSRQPFHVALSVLYDHGYRAVPLFWCLSGTVFMHVYGDRGIGVRAFWRARFARLYPLHLTTLLVVAVLQAMSIALDGRTRIYGNYDLRHAILNLAFIQAWGLERGFSFNGPSWSVSVELAAYLIFFVTLVTRLARLSGALVALALLIAPSLPVESLQHVSQCVGLFFVGTLIERAASRRSLLAGTAIPFVCVVSLLTTSPRRWYLVVVVLIVTAARLADVRWTRVDTSIGRLLGDASYGMFMWHVPIQVALLIIYDHVGVDRTIVDSPVHLVAYLATAIVVGWASHRYFEAPVRRWIARG